MTLKVVWLLNLALGVWLKLANQGLFLLICSLLAWPISGLEQHNTREPKNKNRRKLQRNRRIKIYLFLIKFEPREKWRKAKTCYYYLKEKLFFYNFYPLSRKYTIFLINELDNYVFFCRFFNFVMVIPLLDLYFELLFLFRNSILRNFPNPKLKFVVAS